MKVVADTNTLVSGLLWQGAPRKLLLAAEAGRIELITSIELRRELEGVLRRQKFGKRIRAQRVNLNQLLADLDARLTVIVCPPLKTPVCRDRDDDWALAAALSAAADVIVTGDDDLLTLKSFEHIPIVTARGFLEMISRSP